MRLSLDTTDRGYPAWAKAYNAGKTILIKLDGVEQKHVHTADEEEGFVLKDRLDQVGTPQHDGANWMTDLCKGKVEITIE